MMPPPASRVKRLLDGYDRLLRVILTLLMGAVLIPISLQIMSRFIPIVPRYVWTEEVARFCFVWIIMIGSMVAVRDRAHFDVDLLPPPKTPRGKGISGLIVHGAMLIMGLAFVWYGGEFAQTGFRQTSEMSGINMLSIYLAFPVAGFTWVLFLVEKIADDVRLLANPNPETAP